jgi:hypothetical protein
MQGRLTLFSSGKKSPRRGPLSPLSQPIAFVLPKSAGDDEPLTPPPPLPLDRPPGVPSPGVDLTVAEPPTPGAVVQSPLSQLGGLPPAQANDDDHRALASILSSNTAAAANHSRLMLDPGAGVAGANSDGGAPGAPGADASFLASFFNGVPSWTSPTTPTFKPVKVSVCASHPLSRREPPYKNNAGVFKRKDGKALSLHR